MAKYCHLTTCGKEIVEEQIGSSELRIFKKTGKISLYFDSQEHLMEWLAITPFKHAAV